MGPLTAAAVLAALEKYLYECRSNAAPGSKAEKQFDNWQTAVDTARAYIIAHETMDKLEEDDGKFGGRNAEGPADIIIRGFADLKQMLMTVCEGQKEEDDGK